MQKYRCYYMNDMGEEIEALNHHDGDGDWIDSEEAEQREKELLERIAKLERQLKNILPLAWRDHKYPVEQDMLEKAEAALSDKEVSDELQ